MGLGINIHGDLKSLKRGPQPFAADAKKLGGARSVSSGVM